MVVIWHNNGVKGQRGATEYTDEEVVAMGGIDGMLHQYIDCGATVYSVDFYRGLEDENHG